MLHVRGATARPTAQQRVDEEHGAALNSWSCSAHSCTCVERDPCQTHASCNAPTCAPPLSAGCVRRSHTDPAKVCERASDTTHVSQGTWMAAHCRSALPSTMATPRSSASYKGRGAKDREGRLS